MSSTQAKYHQIETLAIEASWIDLAEHEGFMTTVNRMWNRGAITDALQTIADESRAEKGLAPRAESTQRISYRHPRYEGINFHVELLDGQIKSAALYNFKARPVTSLTGIIRFLDHEIIMNKHR